MVAPPKMPTATSILVPTPCLSGRTEKKAAVSVAPSAGAARRCPRPFGSGVKHVAREHRQHRRRAAEQDREQVEADRAEDQAVVADIAKALDHLRPRVGAAREPRPRHRRDCEQADRGDREQDRARGVRRVRRVSVKIAADRRADDRAGLPCHRRQGDRARQDLARHEVRRERPECWSGERARHSEQCGDDVEDLEGRGAMPGEPGERERAAELERERAACDPAPVERGRRSSRSPASAGTRARTAPRR